MGHVMKMCLPPCVLHDHVNFTAADQCYLHRGQALSRCRSADQWTRHDGGDPKI